MANKENLNRIKEIINECYGVSRKAVKCNANNRSNNAHITNVIFNEPATIIFWSDGTKTVVKAQNKEKFDPEKGLAMGILKRIQGNNGSYYNEFTRWCKNYKPSKEESANE